MFWESFSGKILRYLFFIPAYLLVLWIIKMSIGLLTLGMFHLKLFTFLLFFFTVGSAIIFAVTKVLPMYLVQYVIKICPNKKIGIGVFISLAILTAYDVFEVFYNNIYQVVDKSGVAIFYSLVFVLITLSTFFGLIIMPFLFQEENI